MAQLPDYASIQPTRPPAAPPSLTWPRGFRAAAGTCGIKPSGAPDLALLVADRPAAAAGLFTRNAIVGAPVELSRAVITGGVAHAIVCNSGISNVGTGDAGRRAARDMAERAAAVASLEPRHVLVCSTGVIGQPLPMDRIDAGLAELGPRLASGDEVDAAVARAIMTTDTQPKHGHRDAQLAGGEVRLGGVAKGAGMIAPDLAGPAAQATMLVFLTTDADAPAPLLQAALERAAAQTFNRLSIDADTSTSDSVLLLASGASGVAVDPDGPDVAAFEAALFELCRDLAEQLIRDGEGVTRVMRVHVGGAGSIADADAVGRTVVNSPLVKTALHGGDPNWGRLLMAVGRSGAAIDPARLRLTLGEVIVYEAGAAVALADASRARLDAIMRGPEVTMRIELGAGDATATWLGCDLSRDYVTINADYTT